MKRPIDRLRESAGTIEVGTPDDRSAATGMVKINGILHAIKEGGIYELKLADQIDPDRTDPRVPNMQRRVMNYGSGAEFVRQTLLTADALLRNGMIGAHVAKDDVVSLAFVAAQDLAFMTDASKALLSELEAVTGASVEKGSLIVPALRDLEPRVQAFIQKADHVLQSLLGTVRAFFGDSAAKAWFESLFELSLRRYGKDDRLTLFLGEILPFLQRVRAARNCVEHPKADQRLVLENFSVQLNPLGLKPPTIRVVHPKHPTDEAPLGDFVTGLPQHLGLFYEEMLAFLCSKNLLEFGVVRFAVVRLSPEQVGKNGVQFMITIAGMAPPPAAPTAT